MIYIPIELQLQWIREDLERIKQHVCYMDSIKPSPACPHCNLARVFGITTCPAHSPELNMIIHIPID